MSATVSGAQILHKKKKVNKSTSAENSAEPDKVLYDRAMDDIKHGRHEVGRLNLQTLINTYPDSEYLAKAKLAIADSFYKEGGTSNLTQAVQAYKDFDIFFPMLPEAAYAQLQVAMTHYKQLEKPDRDRSQARSAEDEFQTFLTKYPNDPLAPKAEQHLREVQEILAEGDYRIGYYYYVKGDKKAAESRLRGVVARYPLYSKSDQALWMLGNIWQGTEKKEFAVPYYSRLVKNYPLSPLVPEAKNRLKALGAPIPQADPQAVAWMTAEKNAPRPKNPLYKKPMAIIHTGPDDEKRMAAVGGKPTMTPESEGQEGFDVLNGSQMNKAGSGIVATINVGTSSTTSGGAENVSSSGETGDAAAPAAEKPADGATSTGEAAKPAADASQAADAAKTEVAPSPANPGTDATKTDAAGAPATDQATDAAKSAGAKPADGSQSSSDNSKKESTSKKKKGLRKLVPW